MSNKFYIFQLLDGKMLAFNDGMFFIETTGYPLPDCSLPVSSKILTNQYSIIRAILGYPFEDALSFMKEVMTFEPMLYDDFRLKVWYNNIGGGCPERFINTAIDVLDNGLELNNALYRNILPKKFINDNYDATPKCKDFLSWRWSCKVNKPNYKFHNNIIMYLGLPEVSDSCIDFMKDVVNDFMSDSYVFNYISVITGKNGRSSLLLIDSYSHNEDLEYFYSKIYGVDVTEGIINCDFDEDSVRVSFDSDLDCYKDKKSFEGKVKRYALYS